MLDANRDDHLALPERDRIDDGRLDLLCHDRVGGLDHANLRPCLHGNSPGQHQVMKLFLKAVAHLGVILCSLGVLGET